MFVFAFYYIQSIIESLIFYAKYVAFLKNILQPLIQPKNKVCILFLHNRLNLYFIGSPLICDLDEKININPFFNWISPYLGSWWEKNTEYSLIRFDAVSFPRMELSLKIQTFAVLYPTPSPSKHDICF